MDIILLPVVSRGTVPADALQAMKEARRSVAAVTDVASVPIKGLINSLEVRKAKNSEKVDLKEAELIPLALLYFGDFAAEGYDRLKLPADSFGNVRSHLLQTFPGMAHHELTVPDQDLAAFQGVLAPGMMYGFLGFDRGAAVVMTLHETLGAQAGSPPADCCCRNPATPHEYPGGRKRGGEACDICAFFVEC